jgi:protein subunit release factor A
MESVVVEIRAGVGGEDARLLVEEQFHIYCRWAARRSL